MKKFAICCLALVAVATFVPSAQAATKCIHLTNFCDQIQYNQIGQLGGAQKTEWVGLWDWVCTFANDGTLISGSVKKIATHPVYPYHATYPYAFFANANFTFATINLQKVFDLYGTFDGATTFAFQTLQPYSVTNGPCNPLKPTNALRPALTRK
jgi:hypothetical protein